MAFCEQREIPSAACRSVEPRTSRGVRVVRRRLVGVILLAARSFCKGEAVFGSAGKPIVVSTTDRGRLSRFARASECRVIPTFDPMVEGSIY